MEVLPLKMHSAMLTLFHEVEPDLAQLQDDGEIPQDEVIEVILDAQRLESRFPEIDWTELRALPYEKQCELAKIVFPDKIYA